VAIELSRAGRDVVLIEREWHAKHKVCGEFLRREALRYLELLGIDVGRCGAGDARFGSRDAGVGGRAVFETLGNWTIF
jgi:2-polyprenyl-6-methoxyphenol hydroxylase-like FAD-dependent oxidoreductase